MAELKAILSGLAEITSVDVDADRFLAWDASADALGGVEARTLFSMIDALIYKGVMDCSANPNYPAADAGHVYKVSVAGKIGGASGATVEVGDVAICSVDSTASGTQAGVGTNWNIIQANLVGAYFAGGTDVAVADGGTGSSTASGARTNLGLGTVATLDSDTDGTLAANSDAKIASQKAVKTYVDAVLAGLSWKQMVRAATTVAGTLASSFENGDTIDGVTLATGDRILIKNQVTASENGIYVVAASGAPTRATDADSGAELVNASMYVAEGTTLADTQWVCTTNATITINSTSLTFTQFTTGTSLTKGTGTDIDTGTDDAKYLTAKAINDSHNVPDVAPGTSGNILSSNGTDWVSSLPSTIAGIPSGPFAAPRTSHTEDDEFEGTAQDAKWTKTNSATIESFDDHIRSAAYYQFNTTLSDVTLQQAYSNAGDFSITGCFSVYMATNFHNIAMYVRDATSANYIEMQMLFNGAPAFRTCKNVSSSFTSVASTNFSGLQTTSTFPQFFMHIQRSGNSWSTYYSFDGVCWANQTTTTVTMTVNNIYLAFGQGGAATKTYVALHWFRRDWLTL